MIPLRLIAFARSGDKGDSANVAVFGRSSAAYAWLRDHLSAAAVEEYFRPLGVGRVVRYEVPNLEALNFVLPHVLGGGFAAVEDVTVDHLEQAVEHAEGVPGARRDALAQ